MEENKDSSTMLSKNIKVRMITHCSCFYIAEVREHVREVRLVIQEMCVHVLGLLLFSSS